MKYLQLKLCILSCFFISWLTSATEIKVDIYADDSYPPYSYSENGKLKGIYTDILKKVFSKMSKYKITINPIAWKLGLSYIESGKGFALSPPYHRTKERPYIWPYSIPILDERIIVVCRANVLARTIRSL